MSDDPKDSCPRSATHGFDDRRRCIFAGVARDDQKMRPEMASLHGRMAQGGKWRAFRDEIAALHAEATSEEEYVTLLEAHKNLVAVGKFAFDEETYTKIHDIAAREYRFFLLQ